MESIIDVIDVPATEIGVPITQLTESQLALIGGGIGEVIVG